jgi:hypothetical protein
MSLPSTLPSLPRLGPRQNLPDGPPPYSDAGRLAAGRQTRSQLTGRVHSPPRYVFAAVCRPMRPTKPNPGDTANAQQACPARRLDSAPSRVKALDLNLLATSACNNDADDLVAFLHDLNRGAFGGRAHTTLGRRGLVYVRRAHERCVVGTFAGKEGFHERR